MQSEKVTVSADSADLVFIQVRLVTLQVGGFVRGELPFVLRVVVVKRHVEDVHYVTNLLDFIVKGNSRMAGIVFIVTTVTSVVKQVLVFLVGVSRTFSDTMTINVKVMVLVCGGVADVKVTVASLNLVF